MRSVTSPLANLAHYVSSLFPYPFFYRDSIYNPRHCEVVMRYMRALVKDEGTVLVRSAPLPRIDSVNDVLIRVEAAALCRTDIYVARGLIKAPSPLVLGHEFSGTIVDLFPPSSKLSLGERVVVNPLLPCNKCSLCFAGRSIFCDDSTFLGIHRDGAFAEYIAVPSSSVFTLPEGVDFNLGAYTEPIAASLGVLNAPLHPTERGILLGTNRIAKLTAALLRKFGITNIDLIEVDQLQHIDSHYYDFAIETFATTESIRELIRIIKPRGKIVLKSRQHKPFNLTLAEILKKEPQFYAVNYGSFQTAVDLLLELAPQLESLIGAGYELEAFQEVFKLESNGESKKLFFDPQRRLHVSPRDLGQGGFFSSESIGMVL